MGAAHERPWEPPERWRALHQVELVDALVLDLLFADVLSDHLFVSPHRRDEVASRPEVLPHEVPLPLHERPRDVDGALPLDEPDDLRDRILRWNRQQHVHVIRHQVSFLDGAFLLLRKRSKNSAEVASEFEIQRLSAVLRDEHDVVLAFPFRVIEALILFHSGSPLCVAWWLTEGSPSETPGVVKLRLPPRQSRGVSRLR